MSLYNRDRYEDIDAFVEGDHPDVKPVESDVIMYLRALKGYRHRDLQTELFDKLKDYLDTVIQKSLRRQ